MKKVPRPKGFLPNPTEPRKSEVIGGGYFVFRRGGGTKRIRPATWPFEHADADAALAQAQRLAEANPGDAFETYCRFGPVAFYAPSKDIPQ